MVYSVGTLHPVTGDPMTPLEYNELAEKHGWVKMEQWEIDLRTRLEAEIKPGCYQIGGPGFYAHTGRGGKIQYEVEFHRAMREIAGHPSVPPIEKVVYKKLTYEELKKKIGDALFPDKEI